MKELLAKAPVLKSVEAQIVMQDAYETTYGIHNHELQNDHLALVRKRPAEDVEAFDYTTDRLMLYNAAGVLKYTGITFDRFMDLPRHRGDTLMLACQDIAKKELEEQAKAQQRLEEEKAKLK